VVPLSDSEELHRYFPNAQFRTFEDKGHFHRLERFPEFEEALKNECTS
jgi:pimeloyl-ACP methyl ester carboxylesterase